MDGEIKNEFIYLIRSFKMAENKRTRIHSNWKRQTKRLNKIEAIFVSLLAILNEHK